MNPTATIPPILAVVLPLIVPLIATRLGKDHLPPKINALIALIIAVICAVLWAIYAHTLTSNAIDDFLLIAAYVAALIASPLKPLYDIAGPAMQRLWQYRPWSAYTPEGDNGHSAYPTGVHPAMRQGTLPDQPTRPMPSTSDDEQPPTA